MWRTAFLLLSIPFLLVVHDSCWNSIQAQQTALNSTFPLKKTLSRYNLHQAWWGQAVMNPSRDKVRFLVLDEENLYVQSSSNVLTTFDAITGNRLWSSQLGERDHPSHAVISNRDMVLMLVGIRLYALDKRKGKLRWEIQLPATPSATPAIDEKNVYVASLDGRVHAFDLKRIQELYNEDLLPQWTNETIKWSYKSGKRIPYTPIATGRHLVFASLDKSIYSLTAIQRDENFQVEMDSPVSAPIFNHEGYLYIASNDYNFYCLNATNGVVRWDFVSNQPIRKAPRIVGSDLFITPHRGGMHCLKSVSGRRRWWRPDVTEFLATTPSIVYASDEGLNLILIDRKSGAQLGLLPLRRYSKRLSNYKTDRLYMSTETGNVICIAQRNLEFPLFYYEPELRPISPELAPDEEETAPMPPANTTAPPSTNP